MSDVLKPPFTMIGSEDAAACIDGVCEVPHAQKDVVEQNPRA